MAGPLPAKGGSGRAAKSATGLSPPSPAFPAAPGSPVARFFRVEGDILLLRVKTIPGVARSALSGIRADELVLKVAAPADKGQANEELVAFLAREAGVPRSRIQIRSGETSRHKLLALPATAGTVAWAQALA